MAGAAAVATPKPGRVAAQTSPSIVGAWMSNVVRPDGTVATGLLTFTSDGSVIRTGDTHPTTSPAMGAWSQQENSCMFSYVGFVFDKNGNYIGRQQTRAQATLSADGNSYDATFAIDTMDTSGNITQTSTGGTSHATRLQLQSM